MKREIPNEKFTAPCSHPTNDQTVLFPARDYVSGDWFEIVHCHACGMSFTHPRPSGEQWNAYYPAEYYGANQKSCYRLALQQGADIVIMVHPDYQYTPKLIPAMACIIGNELHPCVLGSRILGGYALKGGMPVWRYVANRFLTLVENLLLGAKLSEYHTGYRAFSRALLERLPLEANSDDFTFDNQMLAQVLWHGYTIAEVSCPTRYFAEASSISFWRSVRYGFGCLATALQFRLAKMKIISSNLFPSVE